jgi:hypothetical protein
MRAGRIVSSSVKGGLLWNMRQYSSCSGFKTSTAKSHTNLANWRFRKDHATVMGAGFETGATEWALRKTRENREKEKEKEKRTREREKRSVRSAPRDPCSAMLCPSSLGSIWARIWETGIRIYENGAFELF